MHMYIYVYVCLCVCVCMHEYTYIHIHTGAHVRKDPQADFLNRNIPLNAKFAKEFNLNLRCQTR